MSKKLPDYSIESSLINDYNLIAGIDEAGRGPLAGPVVAASVILPPFCLIDGIDDSKKLSSKKREYLYDIIMDSAISVGICFIDNNIIDKINILNATISAMHSAIDRMPIKPNFLLIDGNYFKSCGIPYRTIVKGDSISVSIAAASIVAKVERDRWMINYAQKEFPEYSFDKHKGYATKKHYEAITKYGITPIHRNSFLKNFNYKMKEIKLDF